MNIKTLKNDTVETVSFLVKALFFVVRKIYLKPAVAVCPLPQTLAECRIYAARGNDSNLLIVFYVQIMPDDFVMQLHR
ncbi:hypothetical protein M8T30_26380, partial [Enterobacter hormaechei]|nr:hypothetical protein [Enterobacter hormaechei]MCM7949363.1 hypothetical protein [Enterobacter hormaechei]